jgi:hypothetical protein
MRHDLRVVLDIRLVTLPYLAVNSHHHVACSHLFPVLFEGVDDPIPSFKA